MVYDVIIIGAGAAGLFAAASFSGKAKGLILEKNASPGKKILLTGKGKCNLTHAGSAKDFLSHYGMQGKKLRPILYPFNNQALFQFFSSHGMPLVEQEDERIFPKTLRAEDILSLLVKMTEKNQFLIQYQEEVLSIEKEKKLYLISTKNNQYLGKNILITTGGCSYPKTGSDGKMLSILKGMNLDIQEPKPALVPIQIENYPFQELSGTSIPFAEVSLQKEKKQGSLLFTHQELSGPVILDLSRYADKGNPLMINYLPSLSLEEFIAQLQLTLRENTQQISNGLFHFFQQNDPLPKKFLSLQLNRLKINEATRSDQLSKKEIIRIASLLKKDQFIIKNVGSFQKAMITCGGIKLEEINLKSMESIKYPGLFFAGEILDVDGDCGGYNLQFAFSSAHLAMKSIFLK